MFAAYATDWEQFMNVVAATFRQEIAIAVQLIPTVMEFAMTTRDVLW
jgi:hypothetical protein